MLAEVSDRWAKPIEEWDWQELARGRPRCADGTFKGVAPQWVTLAVRNEAKRRLLARANAEIAALD